MSVLHPNSGKQINIEIGIEYQNIGHRLFYPNQPFSTLRPRITIPLSFFCAPMGKIKSAISWNCQMRFSQKFSQMFPWWTSTQWHNDHPTLPIIGFWFYFFLIFCFWAVHCWADEQRMFIRSTANEYQVLVHGDRDIYDIYRRQISCQRTQCYLLDLGNNALSSWIWRSVYNISHTRHSFSASPLATTCGR